MIIGKGLLAENFKKYLDDEQVLIFASGVSNSLETKYSEFLREKELLLECVYKYSNMRLVYFSTCSIYEPVNNYRAYTQHKAEMENIISEKSNNYIIFRLPQVVGHSGNKSTLLNFLINSIKNGQHFEVWSNATRNFIDVCDVVSIADKILSEISVVDYCGIMNIASPFYYNLRETVGIIEKVIGKKGYYTFVDKGSHYEIPLQEMLNVYGDVGDIFGEQYLVNMIRKYYLLSN